jgi:hypothetical protein
MFVKYKQKRKLLKKIYEDFTNYQKDGDWLNASKCAERYLKVEKGNTIKK